MRKNLSKKILLIFFTIIICNGIFSKSKSYAADMNDTKDVVYSKITDKVINKESEDYEKIMKYDAETGEITEVDTNEIKNVINSNDYNNRTKKNNSLNIKDIKFANRALEQSTSLATCKIISNEIAGTAALVGNNVALTAAHCIWNADTKKKYENLVVYPNYNNGAYNLNGTLMASGWKTAYYSNGWMNSSGSPVEYDWAILVLEKELGNTLGYFDVSTNTPSIGYSCGVYGYSMNLNNGNSLYFSSGTISLKYSKWFTYKATVYSGFSGGPIINSSGKIIGVHKGMQDNGSAVGVRITSDMQNIILGLR